MIEADFQRQLAAGLRSQGCYAEKWPDLAKAVTKPFDLLISQKGRFCPTEAKLNKLKRKKSLGPDDVILTLKQFRPKQLPTLEEILDRDQGSPYIAAAIIREINSVVEEQRAFLFPVEEVLNWFEDGVSITLGLMDEENKRCGRSRFELKWEKTIGWIAPWID